MANRFQAIAHAFAGRGRLSASSGPLTRRSDHEPCLSDAELSALRGLPYFVRCLYVLAIRPYMDFRTGVVGLGPRISYRALAEALYVEPHQGEIDAGPPSYQSPQARRGPFGKHQAW